MHGRRRAAQLLPDLLTSSHVVALLDAAGALGVSLAQEVLKLAHTHRRQTVDRGSFGAQASSRIASRSRGEPAADEPDYLVASPSHLVRASRSVTRAVTPTGDAWHSGCCSNSGG